MDNPTYQDFYSRIGCYDMVMEEKRIWCCGNKQNALLEIDREDHTVRTICKFEKEQIDKDKLYRSIQKWNDKIIAIPFSASNLVIYDLKQNRAEYFRLKPTNAEIQEQKECNKKFRKSLIYKDKLYMFGYHYEAIVVLDLNTNRITYLYDWLSLLGGVTKDYRGYINDAVMIKEEFYLMIGCAPVILKMDLRTNQFERLNIKTSLQGFGGASIYKQSIWIVGRGKTNNILLIWDTLSGITEEIDVLLEEEKKLSNPFYTPIITEEYVYLFPMRAKHVYIVDRHRKTVKIWDDLSLLYENNQDNPNFCAYYGLPAKLVGNTFFFITGDDFIWHEYDYRANDLRSYEIKVPVDEVFIREKIKAKFGVQLQNKNKMKENFGLPLSEFLNYLIESPGCKRTKETNIGKKILHSTWKELENGM